MEEYFAIGLMSGTSLDGLDIAYTKFYRVDGVWDFEILKTKSVSYSSELKNKLKDSVSMSAYDLTCLNTDYGKYLANQVSLFIEEECLDKVDLIGSHGHTVFHQPEKGFTLQIGDASWIHKATNIKVISDFRSQDVTLGGQGAPLVPIGDRLLFSEYNYRINIGGFANISYEVDGETYAYDICPVNTILNKYANILGFEFDDKGAIAKSGTVIVEMLEKLKQLDFYSENPPKSLGVEWNEKYVFPILRKYKDEDVKDILRTFTEHVAVQISKVLSGEGEKVLLSGGGAYNEFLVSLIFAKTQKDVVVESKIITEFKEAVVFAFLAVLRNLNEINCLKNVTGAERSHSSGRVHYFV